jgi:hypothetical protein
MANRLSRMSHRQLESLQTDAIPLHGPITQRLTASSTTIQSSQMPTGEANDGLSASRNATRSSQATSPSPAPVPARTLSSAIGKSSTGGLAASRYATACPASCAVASPLRRRAANNIWRNKPSRVHKPTSSPTPPTFQSIVPQPAAPAHDPAVAEVIKLIPRPGNVITSMDPKQKLASVKPLTVHEPASAAPVPLIQPPLKPATDRVKHPAALIKATATSVKASPAAIKASPAPIKVTNSSVGSMMSPPKALPKALAVSSPTTPTTIAASVMIEARQGSTADTAVTDRSTDWDPVTEWGFDPADYGFPVVSGLPRSQPIFAHYEHRFVDNSDSD